jgi:hypothetical protein
MEVLQISIPDLALLAEYLCSHYASGEQGFLLSICAATMQAGRLRSSRSSIWRSLAYLNVIGVKVSVRFTNFERNPHAMAGDTITPSPVHSFTCSSLVYPVGYKNVGVALFCSIAIRSKNDFFAIR